MNKPIPRKVISIPVHFVDSTSAKPNPSLSTSATKIQKVFRGFLVRKCLKKILAVKSEVDKAERNVLDGLDKIRRDPKERLKMNETLMGLLFKLDSIRGVEPGVRECRKGVIKKAIVLQEIIDGCDGFVGDMADMANTNQDFVMGEGSEGIGDDMANGVVEVEGTESNDCGNVNRDLEMRDVIELKGSDEFDADVANRAQETDDVYENINQGLENEEGFKKAIVLEEKIDGCDESGAEVADRAIDMEYSDKVIEYINQGLDEDVIENGEDYVPQSTKCDKFVEPEMEEDEEDYCLVKKVVVGEGDDYETKPLPQHFGKDCFNGDEAKSGNSREKEMMERMMEENGKMMSMMKQLSEQNRAQTQMLSLLSQRVEHLEKAFVREISRKKTKDKKKRMANGVVDGLDCCSDQKKCGKKR